jgi:membrane protease YdiL (CAAX protease family)
MALIFATLWAMDWATVRWTTAPLTEIALNLALYAVTYAAVGGAEELIFRGYLLQTLQEWPGTAWAVGISSFVFGFFHACNPHVAPLALVHLVVAGLVFAYAYLVTRRLWLAIAMHFSWNFCQGPVFGFPVSGLTSSGLFTVIPTGPELATGGAFGPEAGLTGLAALILIALVLWLWNRPIPAPRS